MFSVSSASEVWKLLLDRSQTTTLTSQVFLRQVHLLWGFLPWLQNNGMFLAPDTWMGYAKHIIIPSFIHLNVSDSILPLCPESWCGSKSNCSSMLMIRERGCLLQLTAFPPRSLMIFSLVNWSKVSWNNSCHFQLHFLHFHLPVCLLRFCLSGWVPRLKLTHVSLRASIQNSRHIICRNTPAMTEAAKWTQEKKAHSHLRTRSCCSFHLPEAALNQELFPLHNAAADCVFTPTQTPL